MRVIVTMRQQFADNDPEHKRPFLTNPNDSLTKRGAFVVSA